MGIRWHQLEIVTLLISYSFFLLCTGLIVTDLEVDEHPILAQASHDGLVSLQAMLVLASLEWGYQNCIGIAMIVNHEVLVSSLRLYRVLSRVIII